MMNIKQAIDSRLLKLRNELKKSSKDALLVTSPENVSYLTAFSGQDSWAIAGKRKIWLITDSRYSEQAFAECVGCKIIERKGSMLKAVSKLLAGNKSIKELAVESAVSVSIFENLKQNLDVRITASQALVEPLRELKDDLEIAHIKTSAKLARVVLENSLHQIKPKITESELAGVIEFEMRKLGVSPSFDTIVAFGANASRPHHLCGSSRLRKKDTILIDYGVKYKGYCSDITRCFAVGNPSVHYKKAYNAVQQAQDAAISKVCAAAKIADADLAAREKIKAAGLPDYGHGTGHGLGLNVHELPTVYNANKKLFEPGQIITIEPGVYIPGKLGIRIEDDVLVTKTGCKILTRGKQSPELEVIKL